MSTVIKGGTIVTADLTYEADVLIEGGKIAAIGQNLTRRQRARRHRLLRHARRHRSAHPSRNAVHGHALGRRFRERHARGALRRHHDGRRFRPARPRTSRCSTRCRCGSSKAGKASCDYSFHMAITWWGEQVFEEMADGRRPRHQHLQALHGLQGRADGERRRDVRVVPALRRARRAAAGPCRERRRRRRAAAEVHGRRQRPARRATPIRARPRSRARRPTAPS